MLLSQTKEDRLRLEWVSSFVLLDSSLRRTTSNFTVKTKDLYSQTAPHQNEEWSQISDFPYDISSFFTFTLILRSKIIFLFANFRNLRNWFLISFCNNFNLFFLDCDAYLFYSFGRCSFLNPCWSASPTLLYSNEIRWDDDG